MYAKPWEQKYREIQRAKRIEDHKKSQIPPEKSRKVVKLKENGFHPKNHHDIHGRAKFHKVWNKLRETNVDEFLFLVIPGAIQEPAPIGWLVFEPICWSRRPA